MAIDLSDNIYVADTQNNRVQKFSPEGNFLALWGEYGSNNSQFNAPCGIAVDKSGKVLVVDTNNHRIQVFNSNGNLLEIYGKFGYDNSNFCYPKGIFVDKSDKIYIADTGNRSIKSFRYKNELRLQISLKDSWNLISIPVEPLDSSIQKVFSQIWDDVRSIWEYDPVNGWNYCYFINPENIIGNLNRISAGKGYWIDMVRPGVLEIIGTEPDDCSIVLKQGWNLVGYKSISSVKLCNALSCVNGKYCSIWIYDSISGRLKNIMDNSYYNALEYELGRYEGFWIEMKEDCIWNINQYKY